MKLTTQQVTAISGQNYERWEKLTRLNYVSFYYDSHDEQWSATIDSPDCTAKDLRAIADELDRLNKQ
jgi:hypothetical protein